MFLVYVNDSANGFRSENNLFADGTSLFSIAHDVNTSVSHINKD